ncbi:hypothetical protein BC938DRAFT_473857 [Jimgerdemannia flammicorona]|uniref:Uncharacterized protein n=1 Tax=Jimgerdemannia flammicorona TaxID=994334 RepID=A0A433QSZ4_9FUNG|nr:hypothetical protein BC938DRAFT_473857 [Jimgerdemannia flammicorona]
MTFTSLRAFPFLLSSEPHVGAPILPHPPPLLYNFKQSAMLNDTPKPFFAGLSGCQGSGMYGSQKRSWDIGEGRWTMFVYTMQVVEKIPTPSRRAAYLRDTKGSHPSSIGILPLPSSSLKQITLLYQLPPFAVLPFPFPVAPLSRCIASSRQVTYSAYRFDWSEIWSKAVRISSPLLTIETIPDDGTSAGPSPPVASAVALTAPLSPTPLPSPSSPSPFLCPNPSASLLRHHPASPPPSSPPSPPSLPHNPRSSSCFSILPHPRSLSPRPLPSSCASSLSLRS